MEHGEGSDLAGAVCFTPKDSGLPIIFLPDDPWGNPPEDSCLSDDLIIEAELRAWKLPKSSSPPTDTELLGDHLRPELNRLLKSKGGKDRCSEAFFDRSRNPVVNGKHPQTNPWEMSGMTERTENGRRETYYLTDHLKLSIGAFGNDDDDVIKTPCGIWKPISIGHAVLVSDTTANLFSSTTSTICGTKKTFVFHDNKNDTKKKKTTNWIMNVYSCLSDIGFSEDELFLCHVFEDDSPPSPTCPTSHHACCKGNNCDAAIQAPAKGLQYPKLPVQNGLDLHSEPELERIIEHLGQHEKSKKRRKSEPSLVWSYFTKLLARDRKGNLVSLAACNHCLKVFTAASTNGTNHLRKHKCPCKLEPVKDAQEYKNAVPTTGHAHPDPDVPFFLSSEKEQPVSFFVVMVAD